MKSVKEFRKLTEDIHDLPTLPGVVAQLNEKIRNPLTSARDIGEIITKDQVLTSRALKLVNSAFYGFPRKITNITHSIVILGFQKVRDIVMTASIFDLFKDARAGRTSLQSFWEHSLRTAIVAEAVSKELSSPEVTDAFVAGLLHDIGKVIIALYGPSEHVSVRRAMKEGNLTSYEAEKEVLGFHHGDVGSWLTDRWRFPEKIVGTIRLHHSPDAAREYRELNSIIHISDILARAIDTTPESERVCVISPKVWDEFKLSRKRLDIFYKRIGEGFHKARDFFDLIPKE